MTAAALALTATLAACGATAGQAGAAPGGTPSTGPIHACDGSSLRVVRDPHSAYTSAGSTYLPIDFVNESPATCSLTGYPRVFGIPATQAPRARAANVPGDITLVVLQPSYAAHAWVRIRGASGKKEAGCTPFTGRGFRVFLPNSAAHAWVQYPFTSCATIGQASLTVRPVGPGLGNPAISP